MLSPNTITAGENVSPAVVVSGGKGGDIDVGVKGFFDFLHINEPHPQKYTIFITRAAFYDRMTALWLRRCPSMSVRSVRPNVRAMSVNVRTNFNKTEKLSPPKNSKKVQFFTEKTRIFEKK